MKIMSVDLGKVRTGIAVSDINEYLASPLCVIKERDREILAKKVSDIANENNALQIVVGLPLNMDGSKGESAKAADEFSKILSKYTDADIILQDERGTTISAHSYLNVTNTRGEKRKSVVDAVAATIILQDYLDFRRNNKWELQRTWM